MIHIATSMLAVVHPAVICDACSPIISPLDYIRAVVEALLGSIA